MLRDLFVWRGRVGRGRYLATGVSLAALKYVVDAGLIALGAGRAWWPSDYLRASPLSFDWPLATAAPWLLPVLLAWTIPFLWIGVAMSSRRLRDAGWSEWLSLLFFAPYLSYLVMIVLSIVPTGAEAPAIAGAPPPAPEPQPRRQARLWSAVAAGAIPGILMAFATVTQLENYGAGLFLGVPFVMGACCAYVLNRHEPSTRGQTNVVIIFTFVVVAVVLIGLATEGTVCVVMAVPIGLPIGFLGGELGRAIAGGSRRQLPTSLLGVMAVPFWLAIEPSVAAPPVLHEVQSSVEINAAPDAVWSHVVAFPPLPPPTDIVFRLGIASPERAHIDGQGVGAVRYCEFSTGAFVEPITHWEPGRRLGFDVVSSPPPMREWSPYANIHPPHLDGFLRSKRGEFRLVPLPGGRTRLEGSTWYEVKMAPEGYWQLVSDYLIHRIHARVLDHIKHETESAKR